MAALSELEHQLLQFEEANPRHAGTKEEAIRNTFGLSPARYYQKLLHLSIDPAAIEAYPQLIARMLRRQARTIERAATRTL